MKHQKRVSALAVALMVVFTIILSLGKLGWTAEPVKATVESTYPGLASGVLKMARLTDMEKDVLLKAYQIEIKPDFAKDVMAKVPPETQKELEKNLFFLLEQKAMEMLIRQDAKGHGHFPWISPTTRC